MIALDVNPDALALTRATGYLIPEQGKPPDFVLEVAYQKVRLDARTKRRSGDDYESMGVLEILSASTTPAASSTACAAGYGAQTSFDVQRTAR